MKVIALLLFPSFLFSQINKDTDSLKKYSYHIFTSYIDKIGGTFNAEITGGTVFFIRIENRTFLLTARHVFTGCDSLQKKGKYTPSRFCIQLSNDSGNSRFWINTQVIRDTSKCFLPWQSPDIVFMEIIDKIPVTVNSVENLIHPKYLKTKSFAIIGFPGIKNIDEFGAHYIEPEVLSLPEDKYHFVNYVDTATKKPDTLNYWIVQNDIKTDNKLKGYSGSPLFVQDKETAKWRIAGVYGGTVVNDPSNGYILAGKIELIIDEIQEFLKKH